MPLSPAERYFSVERIIELDFLRATEAAALNALHWIGKGDKEAADQAACDAIRGMFDLIDVCGECVIGEGIKDNAPGIFKGEHLGTWTPGAIRFDIALDPVDGTTNCSKGMPNSISCLAAASPEDGKVSSMQDIPSFYMDKLAYGPRIARWMRRTGIESVKLGNPVDETIAAAARILEKPVKDVVVLVMDRPRHKDLVRKVRETGAALRMFGDGDIAAAIAPSLPDSGADLYMGVGGSPEAVLAAAGVKCLDGDIQARMWPRDEEETRRLIDEGHEADLARVYTADDLAHGKNILFLATGILDSPLVKGVQVRGHQAITHSVLMRAKTQTVRYITTHHNLETKQLRLRSTQSEVKV